MTRPSVPGQNKLVFAEPTADNSNLSFDVVLPLLHGPFGEDGTIQGLLELADVPYVGSGVVGSAVAMDKVIMKRAFVAEGLPVPRWLPFRDGQDKAEILAQCESRLGYPMFVKPANLGSSVGISRITSYNVCYTKLLRLGWVVPQNCDFYFASSYSFFDHYPLVVSPSKINGSGELFRVENFRDTHRRTKVGGFNEHWILV